MGKKKIMLCLYVKKRVSFPIWLLDLKKTTVMYQYLQKNSSSILLNPHLDLCSDRATAP